MKKLVALLLTTVLIFSSIPNRAYSQESAVYFAQPYSTASCSSIIEGEISNIISIISQDYTEQIDNVCYGAPIGVFNLQDYYYIPLHINGNIAYVIKVVIDDEGTPYVSFSNDFSSILGHLESGTYYFSYENSAIYLVGPNQSSVVEAVDEASGSLFEPVYDLNSLQISGYIPLFEDLVGVYSLGGASRAVYNKRLNVTHVPNNGVKGYCWLAVAASMCDYYDNPINMDVAHYLLHGNAHTLFECDGGDVMETATVIYYFTGLRGNLLVNRLYFSQVITQIQNNQPICSFWVGSNNAGDDMYGHAMIVCGYSYDTTSQRFCYILRDPNKSSYQYLYTNFSDTTISYYIGATRFDWEVSLYDFS